MNKKKLILISGAVVILVALVLVLVFAIGADDSNEGVKNPENTLAENVEAKKEYTPTFMYFISDEDENLEQTNKMLEELKKEYDGKVIFDIRNITENPEDGENFPVKGTTPALIMLNTSNDICAMNFMCSDKSELKTIIDSALGQ